jgi:hypothetical protein
MGVAELGVRVFGLVQVGLADPPDQALVVGQPAGGVAADAVLVDQVPANAAAKSPWSSGRPGGDGEGELAASWSISCTIPLGSSRPRMRVLATRRCR